MSESTEKKHYDISSGQMITTAQSIKADHARTIYEIKEWFNVRAAPPEGYGLDGYPLQKGKKRND